MKRDRSALWLVGALVVSALYVAEAPVGSGVPVVSGARGTVAVRFSVDGLRVGDSIDRARDLWGQPGDASNESPLADPNELYSTWVYSGGRWLNVYDGQVCGVFGTALAIAQGARTVGTVKRGMPMVDVRALLGPGVADEYNEDCEVFQVPGGRGSVTVAQRGGVVRDFYLSGGVAGGRVVP